MKVNDSKQRIAELVRLLNYHSEKYYTEDNPEISDYKYDMMMRELKTLESEHPDLVLPNSPTQRVGDRTVNAFAAVHHEVPLKSLQDVFSYEELEEFDNRVKIADPNAEYVVELKIDGLSVAVEYKSGTLYRAATRGNGTEGEDVTQNVLTIASLPHVLKEKIDITVRGEVYMSRANFDALNEQREKREEQLFANPRNAAAGSLRQLNSAITSERKLDMLIFNVQKCDSHAFLTHSESLDYLKNLGFRVSPFYNRFKTIESAFAEIERFDKIRDTIGFDIDGAVVKVNSLTLRNALGETVKYPKWAVAYKYHPEQKSAKLKDIEINVGRTGVLTPTAVFEPIMLSGTKVSRATLHNRNFIRDLDIKIGDTVIVQKAGEIIPEVVRVDTDKRDGSETEFVMPSVCPVCGRSVTVDASGVAVRCTNPLCDAKVFKQIVHFASKPAMNIDGLGPAIVQQLIDNDLVHDVSDLYLLTSDQLETLEGFARTSADNLVNSINNSKNAGLDHVLVGLGIQNIGEKAAKLLADRFKSIDAILDASIDDITDISDFGEISAACVVDFFALTSNLLLVKKLREYGVSFEYSSHVTDLRFAGKTFVLSGGLDSMTREEASSLIESFGGKTSSSVSSKTSYLLLGDKPGSKLDKANKLGVEVIDETKFLEMIK